MVLQRIDAENCVELMEALIGAATILELTGQAWGFHRRFSLFWVVR
jgi:hypothetical protein